MSAMMDDRTALVAELRAGEAALRASLAGLDVEMVNRSPAPDRWSILQCVEHLAVVEDYLCTRIEQATRADRTQNDRREQLIVERGLDRSFRFPAPTVAEPAGRFSSLEEAIGAFADARARTIRFVETCGDDLRALTTTHPLIGTVNCHEMLLVMAVHPRRHVQQIEEIRQSLG